MDNQKKPKVSIIIPSYNHEKYIGQAIDSVVSQTFKDWELIVIDDGSKDNSVEIIKKSKDPRIKLFVQENRDAPFTINRGIRESSGDYIAILNSDDTFEPQKIQKSVQFLDQGLDFVFGKLYVIDEKGKKMGDESESARWIDIQLNNSREPDNLNKLLFRLSYTVTTSNFVFRKKIIEDIGYFHEKLHYAHDYNFLIKIFGNNKKVKFIPEYLSSYRIHSSNTISKGPMESYLELGYSISRLLRKGSCLIEYINPSFFQLPVVANIVSFYSLFSEEEMERIISDKNDPHRLKLLEFIKKSFEFQAVKPYEDINLEEGEDLRPLLVQRNYEINLLKRDLFKIRSSLRWKIPNYIYKKFPKFSNYLGEVINLLIK
jgi:glycosyltransferase involved in cell wall biosynthesis